MSLVFVSLSEINTGCHLVDGTIRNRVLKEVDRALSTILILHRPFRILALSLRTTPTI